MEKKYITIVSFAFLFLLGILFVYAATAQIPANGATNWGDDLRAFLEAGHNDAGVTDAYVAGSITNAALTADTIDGTALADTITLDATTTIATGTTTPLVIGPTGTNLFVIKKGTFTTPTGVATTTGDINDVDAFTDAVITISCNGDMGAGVSAIANVDGDDDADGDTTIDFIVRFSADPADGIACDYFLVR